MVRFGDAKELWSPVLQPVIDKHTSMSSPYLYASSVFLQHFFSKFFANAQEQSRLVAPRACDEERCSTSA
jgi:hypothetical protein